MSPPPAPGPATAAVPRPAWSATSGFFADDRGAALTSAARALVLRLGLDAVLRCLRVAACRFTGARRHCGPRPARDARAVALPGGTVRVRTGPYGTAVHVCVPAVRAPEVASHA